MKETIDQSTAIDPDLVESAVRLAGEMQAWAAAGCDPEQLPEVLRHAIGMTIWAGLRIRSEAEHFTTFTPTEGTEWADKDWSVIVVNHTNPNYERALAVLSGVL